MKLKSSLTLFLVVFICVLLISWGIAASPSSRQYEIPFSYYAANEFDQLKKKQVDSNLLLVQIEYNILLRSCINQSLTKINFLSSYVDKKYHQFYQDRGHLTVKFYSSSRAGIISNFNNAEKEMWDTYSYCSVALFHSIKKQIPKQSSKDEISEVTQLLLYLNNDYLIFQKNPYALTYEDNLKSTYSIPSLHQMSFLLSGLNFDEKLSFVYTGNLPQNKTNTHNISSGLELSEQPKITITYSYTANEQKSFLN